jgi:hypothetical protein
LAELPQLRHASLPATADFEFKSPAINTHFQTGFQITRPGFSNFPNKIKFQLTTGSVQSKNIIYNM